MSLTWKYDACNLTFMQRCLQHSATLANPCRETHTRVSLNLYWIEGALAFVCFSFFFFIFFLATCARLSWILSFRVHVKCFYRIVTQPNRPEADWTSELVRRSKMLKSSNCRSQSGCRLGPFQSTAGFTHISRHWQNLCRISNMVLRHSVLPEQFQTRCLS